MIQFISNGEHYTHVLSYCKDVSNTLWIGIADIKDAYIDVKGEIVSKQLLFDLSPFNRKNNDE